ncbi:MAG TPA: 30S ribosomal protein S6 [Acidobacteriota bacterium]|nr:30S ribosomal protein S6 [Acidobacteriota bacterium]
MRRYEVTYVVAPGLTPEEVEQTVDTYKGVAEEFGAKIVDVDNWGKRKLAFEVKKHKEGFYVVMYLESENGEAVTELERRFKVADPIIRFLTVRVDEEMRRAEKMKALREEKKARKKARAQARRAEAAAEESDDEDQADESESEEAPEEAPEKAEEKAKKEKPSKKAKQEKEDKSEEEEAGDDSKKDKGKKKAKAKSDKEDSQGEDEEDSGEEGEEE